jgi:nucleoside phosphorylase
VFRPAPKYQPASDRVLEAIRRFTVDRPGEILALPALWRGSKIARSPVVIVGPVASGAAVVENQTLVNGLLFRDRKLVALEMESYGFYLSARHSVEPKSQFVMIKGACDKASPQKTDGFQAYAAFISAQLIYRFIVSEMSFEGGLFCKDT